MNMKNHKKERVLYLNFDGSYRKSYGKSEYGCGWTLCENHKVLHSDCFGGEQEPFSSNSAEYLALLRGLEFLNNSEVPYDKLVIVGDSKLVINQISGLWSVRKGIYIDLAKEVFEVLESMNKNWTSKWTSRNNNQECDELSKRGLNGECKM